MDKYQADRMIELLQEIKLELRKINGALSEVASNTRRIAAGIYNEEELSDQYHKP